MTGRWAECDGGSVGSRSMPAARETYRGRLTGEWIDIDYGGGATTRWYRLVVAAPYSERGSLVWCESGFLFMLGRDESDP